MHHTKHSAVATIIDVIYNEYMIFIIYYIIEGIYMYLTKINCDLLISSPSPSVLQSQSLAMHLSYSSEKKSTWNFVVHVTDESSCEVEIEKKKFLVLNSNDNDT